MQEIFDNLISNAVFEIQNQNKKISKKPYLDLFLSGMALKGLYDTGADVSCIDEKTFRRIPVDKRPAVKLIDKAYRFKGAGDQDLDVRGRFTLPLKVGQKQLAHEFFVIKSLGEELILGIDFMHAHKLNYDTHTKRFSWRREGVWEKGLFKVCEQHTLPPLSLSLVRAKLSPDNGAQQPAGAVCVVSVCTPSHPLLTAGPSLVTTDSFGNAIIPVYNCSPVEAHLQRNDFLGGAENAAEFQMNEINPEFINSIRKKNAPGFEPPSAEKLKFIKEKARLDQIPPELRQSYLRLLVKNHQAVSQHKFDLGRASTLMHDIELKTNEPIYVKQFKIPEAHRQEVEKHVAEWLKLGVVQPTRSKYNSPIFAVAKKNGGVRLVQDFRALNAQTMEDKYSMKDVSECINEIGRSGSTIFTTIDLTAGFWQMLLEPKSRPYTAFTVPGQGQFHWVCSPMGLQGMPSSFQRLIETVVHGIPQVIAYIDDLLVHSDTHDRHLEILDLLLQRLVEHRIKINLEKCEFGSKRVAYLGFQLTEDGIVPGEDKLKAVGQAPPPSNVKEIRQFLGLCNFFRNHVRNFAQITAPLTALTRKDTPWKSGPLPPEALQAFRELQSALVSKPVVAYPRKDRQYALITDASLGDDTVPGGLGAILSQIDSQGTHHVIAYASRKLQKHEKNYTPFLLEMQAAIWGMDHFSVYLRGRPFTLFTDHKPLEKLGKVHTRTLNRLQEAMNEFNFQIVYKKGSEMPADFLSRNVVSAITWNNAEMAQSQNSDPVISALKRFLLNRELPLDTNCQSVVKFYSSDSFVEDGLVWRRVKRANEPDRVVLFLPKELVPSVLAEAHGSILAGHDGIFKTKERLLSCYYWPAMDKDIAEHIKSCHKCQVRRKTEVPPPPLLSPLPQCTEPGQRVHADLFGPLKASGNNKKYILCMTDAFTKYVELVALPNKEAETVAEAIFSRWICRFSCPIEVVTDQGKEFCAKLTDDLFKLLQIKHTTTTAYHPQCNSQAEVANKTIAKYLASFVNAATLDWELYLAPLMLSYNTSFHSSVRNSPFFLTFGIEPRTPNFEAPEMRRKFYGESSTDDLYNRLKTAREVAAHYNSESTEKSRLAFDKKARPHSYQVGQFVLLSETNFLHRNAKLSPKWTGPHEVLSLKGDTNLELRIFPSRRKLIVHVNRLKPYHSGVINSDPLQQHRSAPRRNHSDLDTDNDVDNVDNDVDDDVSFELSPEQLRVARQLEDEGEFFAPPSYAQVAATAPPPRAPQAPRAPPLRHAAPPTSSDVISSRTRSKIASQFSVPQGGMVEMNPKPTVIMPQLFQVVSQKEGEEGWVMVAKKRKTQNSAKQAWTKAQNKAFLQTGDIYASAPSYKSSVFSEFSAVGQQQPQQQQVQVPIPVQPVLPQPPQQPQQQQPPPPPPLPPPPPPPLPLQPPQPPPPPQPRQQPQQPPPFVEPEAESDETDEETIIRRYVFDENDSNDDDADDDLDENAPSSDVSWRTASEPNTPGRQVREDLDETVTPFNIGKSNFGPSPGVSPTPAFKPRTSGTGTIPKPFVVRPPVRPEPQKQFDPRFPPDLDKAFADLGAPSSSRTRSRTGPLPEETLHKPPPPQRKKK